MILDILAYGLLVALLGATVAGLGLWCWLVMLPMVPKPATRRARRFFS